MATEFPPLAVAGSVRDEQRASRDRVLVVGAAALLGAAATGVFVGELTLGGHAFGVAALIWFLIPVIAWRWPPSGVVMLAGLALVIEEYPSIAGLKTITESLPVFKSLSAGVGLSGLVVNPAELVIATILLTWIAKGAAEGTLGIPRSQLAAGVGLLALVVVAGELHGLATGGNLTASLWELRPWAYLAVLFVLSSQLITSLSHVRAVMWTVVVGTGLKGVEGALRYVLELRSIYPPPANILAHEEAVFFGIYMLLTGTLWLYGVKGRLRQVATALLPFVIFANLANDRRTSYVILGAGVAILIAVAWARSPQRRWVTGGIAVALLAATALYLPIFWNKTGVLAAPAAAIRSAIDPNQRDAASDLYRTIENLDLGMDIHNSTPLGMGFGKPIPTPFALPNITSLDSFISYEPHNTILYLWLRLGFPGAIAFWWMIGAAIIAACQLARRQDAETAALGTLALLAISAYLIEGWYDQGVVSLRVAIVMGAFLGTVEAARRLAPAREPR